MRSGLALFLVLSSVVAGCGAIAPTPAPAVPTVVLGTGATTPRPASAGITASGTLRPAHEARLALTVGGRVAAVHADLGVQVEAGQALLELDSAASQREYDQAKRDLAELTSPAAIARASLTLAEAKKAFQDAQTNYNNMVVDFKKGALLDAQDWLAKASARYQFVLAHHDAGVSGSIQVEQAHTEYIHALQAVQKAESNYAAKQAAGLAASPSTVDIVTGQYEVARADLAEAQNYLDALRGEEVAADATGARLAQLASARSRLAAAHEQLTATRMVAPFSGTVTALNVAAGENAAPGQVLIVLSDVTRLHAETTDLSERDVPKVKVGETVSVLLKALNRNVAGHVSAISSTADTLGGDVVYKATIELDSQPEGLRSGMSVEVDFGTAE